MKQNIWLKGSVKTNPYYETAFQALGISRDVVSRAEIGQKVEEKRQAVRLMPGFFKLGERPLTDPDVTQAGQILADPTRRMLEELLVHKPETLPVDELDRLEARLPQPDWPEELPPPRHLRFLLRVIQEMALDALANLPPVDPPPFPINLDTIPPFGPEEIQDE
jgi:hypothetical protein